MEHISRPIKEGKHDYYRRPAIGTYHNCYLSETFSTGIFQWIRKSGGNGFKRGPVKVRVHGYTYSPRDVYAKAREIASELDRGIYTGKKNVSVM